jgi:hypothetical protein
VPEVPIVLTILEGPDGGGKTTLARWFTKMGGVIEHHGPYNGVEHTAPLYERSVRHATSQHVVMDRAWQAEPIYGNVYREGGDRVGVAYRRMLERLALSVSGVVVLCRPPWINVRDTWRTRAAEEYLDNERQLSLVYAEYNRVRTDLPMVRYDYTRMGERTLRTTINDVRPWANQGPGIGRWAPGLVVLLVGEGPSDNPFVGFTRAGCSAWLAERLEEAKISEASLYWVNAIAEDGRPNSTWFIRHLRPRWIVAMGRVAEEWLGSGSVFAYTPVVHPQFHKRFHHREPYALVDAIQEGLR